jgi:hypothetical protein
MRLSNKIRIVILALWILFIPVLSFAQIHVELTPGVSLNETYDDNIYLDQINETSDFITTFSPNILLDFLSQNSQFSLQYSPTFVWYDKEDQNDTIRHSASFSFSQELSQNLRFDLSNSYDRSEDPLDETDVGVIDRDTRNIYWRNSGRSSLRYIFGPENEFSLGYGMSILENEDIALDDNKTQDYFSRVIFWINPQNGMELNYRYIEAAFYRDDNSTPGDNYTGQSSSARYSHRFTTHTTGSIYYGFTSRRFDGNTEDYNVHDASIGFDHAFTQDLSASLDGGYFWQVNAQSNDVTGYTYNGSLVNQFEHGQFSIGGSGGWGEFYQETDRRGFARYWSLNTNIDYQIIEPLNFYVGASYRHNRDAGNRDWEHRVGNCGFRWTFFRWYSLSLDYSNHKAVDDIPTAGYEDNRVMLTISMGRLFRW